MSRGYPARYAAWKLGVHYKTVEAWHRKAGTDGRAYRRLLARVMALEPMRQKQFAEKLNSTLYGESDK